MTTPDVVIIGSGIGGASVAAGLAGSGARILILEAGDHIARGPKNRDQKAIFQAGVFRPKEVWHLPDGTPFSPGNYYNVGGNSKFYGAVLTRYRREDFLARAHPGGHSAGWPFGYEELERWYTAAEKMFRVRGALGEDPSEPPHSAPYDFPPVPEEKAIALVRERMRRQGLHPFSLPLGVDIDTWLSHGKHPWDAHPSADEGKSDAETCPLKLALADPNVTLQVRSKVVRLETEGSGRRIARVVYERDGERHQLSPRLVILAAGAVQSAALLLRSANDRHPRGLANGSDQVGRNFMNHNCSAVLAISPTYVNTSVYQKTFGINDYYNSGGEGGLPLGNIQLLGRVSGTILKANLPSAPQFLLDRISRHAIDFYAMSEDLPDPDSRVTVDGEKIFLDWKRSNWEAHLELVKKLKRHLRAAGFPLVLARAFDRRTPSHQCGTARIGTDAAKAPLDVHGRAHEVDNLFVTDASGLPTSAAVNPALTIAALALRSADHIRRTELAA